MKVRERNREDVRGVLGGTLSLTLSAIIVKLLGVIYKIPLAHILGEEGMGYFNSAYTVYAFFYLLCTAGVPKAVMILISEAEAKGRGEVGERIVSVALRAFLIIGAVLTFIFVVFAAPLAHLIGNDKSMITMIAVAPSMIFISLSGVIRGCLSANMRFLTIAASQISEGVGKLVMGLILALAASRAGLPLPIISAITMLGVSFGALLGLLHLYISARPIGSSRGVVSSEILEIMRSIFRISLPITISAAIMSITNIIDLSLIMRRLIAGGYSEIEATALYGNYTTLAVPMFNLAVSVISPVSIAFLPVFTRAAARQDTELGCGALRSALRMSAFLAAPIMIGMMVYSREILSLLYGNIGIDVGAPLLTLISPAVFCTSILLVLNSYLEATGAVRAPVISMIVGSICKIFVSIFLISDPAVGISGAPIGTLACYVAALITSVIIAFGRTKVILPIISSYAMPLVLSLAVIIPSESLYRLIAYRIGNTFAFLVIILTCAVLYLTLSLAVGIIGKKRVEELAKYTKTA